MKTKKHTNYIIEIPKDNNQNPLIMEQVLSSIHSLNRKISLEIWATKDYIRFSIWGKDLTVFKSLLEGHYPGICIREQTDQADALAGKPVVVSHLSLNISPIFPIRRYSQTADYIKKEWVNPYQAILAPLAGIQNGDTKGIQIIFDPLSSAWRKKGMDTLVVSAAVSSWWVFKRWWGLKDWFIKFIYYSWTTRMLFLLVTWNRRRKISDSIDHRSHTRESGYEAARSKLSQAGFAVCIRLIYCGESINSRTILRELAGGFNQFNIDEFNGFRMNTVYRNNIAHKMIKHRKPAYRMVLSVEELAGILHLPDISVKTPELARTVFTPVQSNYPDDEGIAIGSNENRIIRIPHHILRRHTIIIGRTGSGKTTFAFNLIRELIDQGKGVGVIDPHGDLINQILNIIPGKRVKDTVLIDPTDTDYPVAFNPFKIEGRKDQVVSAIVDSMRRIFEDFWGPQTDYLLRQTVATLIECPGETMLSVSRLLLDSDYRRKCLAHLSDPVLLGFWQDEYRAFMRLKNSPITPILNKIGRFMVPVMRNILGQKENRIDFRKIMDESQILLVNLAKGVLGEENSALLGNFLLAHLQLSVLTRSELPPEKRQSFYLFVDELQSLLDKSPNTASSLFTESRKYGLGMIAACQHLAQFGNVIDTVLGNVNTVVSFGVGPKDARILAEYFQEITMEDLLNLPLYHGYLRMIYDRPHVLSFKNIPPSGENTRTFREEIIRNSRTRYARPLQAVSDEIRKCLINPEEYSNPIPDTCNH